MRPVYPVGLAGAALAALLAAGCADRAALRSASDAEPDAAPSGPRAPAATATHPVPDRSAPMRAPQAPQAPPGPALRGALLTDADVAAEGVRPAVAGPALPAVEGRLPQCLSRALRGGGPAAGKVAAAWRYPTGSVLASLVAGYAAPPAAERVLRAAGTCGRPLSAPGAPAGPAAVPAAGARWCEPNGPAEVSCTALMAVDDRVSLVTVRARSGSQAAEAVNRLAPMAEAKLRRG